MYVSIPQNFYVNVYYDHELILNKDVSRRQEVIIGVSLPVGGSSGRWPKDRAALEQYARTKNATLKFSENAVTIDDQVNQVEKLIAQGIDVLILAPVNSEETSIVVKKAKDAGVGVIVYDRLILNSDLDLYVSFNNVTIGELQGRYLTQRKPKGNYIILSGSPADNNSIALKDGAMIYIRPLAGIKDINIVTEKSVDNWNAEIAYNIVKTSLIENNNRVDAILAPNDALAGAAIKALEEQGLAGKVLVTGQNADLAAVKRIIAGTQSMTVFTDIRKEAEVAVESAIALANDGECLNIYSTVNNGKMNVPSIILTPVTVDKYNLNEVLINSGYFSINDIYQT